MATGKATTLDTKVYMAKNSEAMFKTVGDLKVGDYIIGDDGKSTKVIHLNPIIFEKTYKIYFDDGEIVECNGEHLWKVYDKDYKNRTPDHERTVIRNTDFLYTHFKDRFKKNGEKD